MPVVVIGLNHRSAPVTLRERFAFAESDVPDALGRMRDARIVDEAVILSTCNRMEIYAAGPYNAHEMVAGIRKFLFETKQIEDELGDEIYSHADSVGLEHLFKVASGLDSMLLGETEILGQLKKAYDLALHHKYTGKTLNRAFQKAFNVAKQIRTETNIQRGSVSVAAASVELAEKIFDRLQDKKVMVIGAGDTSEKSARALLSRGAHSVLVSNRSFERAEALAESLGGRAIRFDDWSGEFANVDIIISSTAAPHYVIDRRKLGPMMASRKGRPLLLIDIAVPRDVEPEVNFMENVFLYNVDDLQAIADDYMQQRKKEIALCEKIIRQRAEALLKDRQRLSFGRQNQQAAGAS